jgi:NADH dehydrogenase [ubiquinone] 1 alpha subcomplex assembly factor 1
MVLTLVAAGAFVLHAAALDWRPVDDVVMGGRSASSASVSPGGALLFEGAVSLENGGGFASLRTGPARHDFSGAAGIVLRLRGDGKRYRLSLRTAAPFDGVQYQATFTAPAGDWSLVELPWERFEARFRGRPVPGAPPLDPAQVQWMGLVIGDRQEGRFSLELDSLRALLP